MTQSADSPNIELETEIRKLKLELLKQELDDKLLSFKAFLERKQNKKIMSFNQTNNVTNQTQSEDTNEKPFGTILFAPVIGDFEVWHFVFLIFFAWIFLIILISYVRRQVIHHRLKHQRKKSLKIRKNTFKRLKENESKIENLFKVSQVDMNTNEYENIDLSKPSETSTVPDSENEQKYFDFDDNILPAKRDFFLYTIAEHEQLTKKTFSYKKRYKNSTMVSKLSKSDPNISNKI